MHLWVVGMLAFLGAIWLVNVTLAFGLLLAPRRMVGFLTRSQTKVEDWLRLLGVVILANTVFGVLASVIANAYHDSLVEILGMPL